MTFANFGFVYYNLTLFKIASSILDFVDMMQLQEIVLHLSVNYPYLITRVK